VTAPDTLLLLEEPYFQVKWYQGAGQLTSSLPAGIAQSQFGSGIAQSQFGSRSTALSPESVLSTTRG